MVAEEDSGKPPVEARAAWSRVETGADAWQDAIQNLASGAWSLFGLWGDVDAVHLAVLRQDDDPRILTAKCAGGGFPSVAARHPPATRLERAISDLFGHAPIGAHDTRGWLDHGRWGVKHPLGSAAYAASDGSIYQFLPTEGPGLHHIPVGPVHAGIIEPGHFRFTANGETVVRLEERLGYVHKGIERLMAGSDLDRGAHLAGRTSGDSTVAYALAFARAAEAAHGVRPPARAVWLRALMAELERLANHFGDIGAICNDASFVLMHAHCGILRELVLRACDACFGHRLMRDRILPGGVTADLSADGAEFLGNLMRHIKAAFPELVELYDNTASLQDRTVGTGVLTSELARQYGCGGYVGRASGRAFDTRRMLAYEPYDQLQFEVVIRTEGDVDARVRVRMKEVDQSVSIVEQILGRLPSSDLRTELPASTGEIREGMGVVESFRGDVLAWLRLDAGGRISRCHLRDPSWFQWPVLEAAIEGNIVADFPLCNKSFNCSYSGHDL
ncbi:MAG: hydrogenase large subunit [Alphaproteobacteria bacterium]